MIGPYKMVVVNVIASLVVVAGLLIWKYAFKKKIKPLLLLIIISLLPLLSILRKGTYESGDLTLHASGITSMYNSLRDGNIIPRWAGEVFNGYGSPHHLMMYFLSRYIIAFIHLFGVPMLVSVKLFLALSFIFSGITMYYWMKFITNEKAAFFASLLYLFAPYHLVDMHFRVEPGEMLCFVLLPLCFLGSAKILKRGGPIWIILEAFFISGLILSHQAIAILSLPLVVIYHIVLSFKDKNTSKNLVNFFVSFILAVCISAFYWIPILFEAKLYTLINSNGGIEFHGFWEYIFSPWRYGLLFQGPKGQLSFLMGYVQLIVLLLAVIFIVKKKLAKKYKTTSLLFLLFFISFFFLMQRASEPLWNIIPLIKFSQNSYRLLLIIAFINATVGGIIILSVKSKKIIIFLCIATVLTTILNWGNRGIIPQISEDSYFIDHAKDYFTDAGGIDFSLPRWVDTKKINVWKAPQSPIQTLSGDAQFSQIFRTSTKHEYLAKVNSPTIIQENTSYFPGWNLYINNHIKKIDYKNEHAPGLITFSLPQGVYKIEVVFENTKVRNVGDFISLLTAIGILVFFMLKISQNLPKLKI